MSLKVSENSFPGGAGNQFDSGTTDFAFCETKIFKESTLVVAKGHSLLKLNLLS